jgi:hypothetical protein
MPAVARKEYEERKPMGGRSLAMLAEWFQGEDIRRKLEYEAARQGVTLIVSKDGVLLEPDRCPTCRHRHPRGPGTCEHVDYNVGVMVRCVLEQTELHIMDGKWAGIVAGYEHVDFDIDTGEGAKHPEALARLLIKLWAPE